MSDSEQIYWNQLLEPPIKPRVNNSSKWRRRAEAERVSTPGPASRPPRYRFWANARPLSEPGALPLSAFVCQSTSAVIKGADKASNKPKKKKKRETRDLLLAPVRGVKIDHLSVTEGPFSHSQPSVRCVWLLLSRFPSINGKSASLTSAQKKNHPPTYRHLMK